MAGSKSRSDMRDRGINTLVEDTLPQRGESIERPETELSISAPLSSTPIPEGRVLEAVRLDVFVKTRLKPDQAAGFIHYAKRLRMGARTLPEWEQAYEAFLKRPI